MASDTSSSVLEEEIECLKACFSPEEMEILIFDGTSATIKFNLRLTNNDATVSFVCEVPSLYPSVSPAISVSCVLLSNEQRMTVERNARSHSTDLIGSPMLMELAIWVKNAVSEFITCQVTKQQSACVPCDKDLYLSLMMIDHMRCEARYIKTLKSWSCELNIKGVILMFKKWIFLLLQGPKKVVKDFITRLRTSCVDVTLSGKACKEKMSKVLHEGLSVAKFTAFSVKQFSEPEEVEVYLSDVGLEELYCSFIWSSIKSRS